MPLYDYECQECDKVHEEFRSYEDRHTKSSCACGGALNMLPPGPSIHLFNPFELDVSPTESVRVETKNELKIACKRYGKYAPGYDILEHTKEI